MDEREHEEQKEIEEKVRLLVAQSLGRPESAVTMNASLTEEIGADSLDFLDIVFSLERAFGIQISRGEIERTARGDMSDEEFAPDGVISEAGLTRLRTLMPEAAERITAGLRPMQILTLFSVRTFASIVLAKRTPPPGAGTPAAAP